MVRRCQRRRAATVWQWQPRWATPVGQRQPLRTAAVYRAIHWRQQWAAAGKARERWWWRAERQAPQTPTETPVSRIRCPASTPAIAAGIAAVAPVTTIGDTDTAAVAATSVTTSAHAAPWRTSPHRW